MKNIFKIATTTVLLVLLSACGGGGGSDDDPDPTLETAIWDRGTWDNVKWQ